jgi:hypothetical protein
MGRIISLATNFTLSNQKQTLKRCVLGIKNWIQSEDVAIVDRGFRDATEFLKMHGLQVEMPSY